jgi:hypothetical protein
MKLRLKNFEFLLSLIFIISLFFVSAWSLLAHYDFSSNDYNNYYYEDEVLDKDIGVDNNEGEEGEEGEEVGEDEEVEGGEDLNEVIETSVDLYINRQGFQPVTFEVFAGQKLELKLNSLDNGTYTLFFVGKVLEDYVLAVGPYGQDSIKFKVPAQEGVYVFRSIISDAPVFYGAMKVILPNNEDE